MTDKKTGGALIAQTLARLGVRDVFALHGGHLDAFLVACPDEGIRLTDFRHEASAGHAADAYARSGEGALGVCVVTAGPGFTNALTPMTSAYVDAVPVLFIVGSPPLREVETNPLQGGIDQVAMAAPVTKWAHRVTNIERLPDLIEKAIRIATTGRPGPVLIDVPIDVMFMPSRGIMFPVDKKPVAPDRPAPSRGAVERALDMLANAKRPVVIAGGGTVFSRCSDSLRRFSETAGIPVCASNMARGILPENHPHYVGGVASVRGAVQKGAPPDVVVMAGARAGLYLGGRSGLAIPNDAKIIQIDVNGGEIGRMRPVDQAIVADCDETFLAFAAAATGRKWPERKDWIKTLQAGRLPFDPLFKDAPKETRPGVLHPYHAVKTAMDALEKDTIVVIDGGEAGGWATSVVRSAGPGLCMQNGYLGCLGIAQGFAIGAAIANPGKPVAIFAGDGAVGFNIQEFDTMVRHNLPIVTIVMNNSCWAISRRGQDIVFGENRRSIVSLANTRYDQVAVAFGGAGEMVDSHERIASAIREAQATRRPVCVNLIVDPEVVNPAIPPMVGDPSTPNQIMIPYYENIPTDA
ncbi:MAG: thiamine pyrophosphate-binding protein [Rhodoblastus sp.]